MGKRDDRNSGAQQGRGGSGSGGASLLDRLDPTKDTDSGNHRAKPAIKHIVRRAEGGLPAALMRRFSDANLLTQSAALAYYSLLSIAPLLLLLIWLTASLMPSAQEQLMQQIGQLIGGEAEALARTIIENAEQKPGTGSLAGIWSTILLFFGATVVFGQLQDALNRIFRTEASELGGLMALLRKRVFSLGLVFAIGFLLLVSMTMNTVLQVAFSHMKWLMPLVAGLATWLVYAFGFALMYHYLPDRRVGWRHALGGGAVTALLFVIGRALIGWYLQRSDPGSAYGSMGTVVITIVWVYYAGLIVFIGALLTAVVDERLEARDEHRPAS
ncbi:YihY/virulence factor BrkB family protein [Lysobacter korlensis]|uniref:YihY/virulence factor BrkB family protein n=1 Tax=Lysobacter korlensis TaxID=553636 RepID=A0ABV6RQ61_9GAMM